jgi:hypothetical protein
LKRSDLIGQIFGELHVVGLSEISRNDHSRWHVKCSCGVEKTVLGTHLISGKIISCGHKMRENGRRNFKGVGDLPLSYYSSLRRGANGGKGRKPIEFDVSIQYLWDLYQAQNGICWLSLLPIDFKSRTASLDRIDNSKGYIEGNVQWLHKDVNMMKRHYTQEYFLDLCDKISEARI